jgi:multiple antibiotic resistance protein
MKEFEKYFIMGFSALLPLINPPGSALELLGVVGVAEAKTFKVLARKIAVNTTFFLAVVALAGPYALKFFGISVEALQLVGGAVLAAMGWRLLNKPASEQKLKDAGIRRAAEECIADCWQSKMFYPLTFPVTVGPGSVAVMLTLSAQANSLALPERISAFLGLLLCVALLSFMVFICYAYAPLVAGKVPPALAHGVLRIIAFLLICIGVQISWNGMSVLLVAAFR